MAKRFLFLKVEGSPFQIGLQIGESLKERISLSINQILDYELGVYKKLTFGEEAPPISTYTKEYIFNKARIFLPLFKKYCPQMLMELRGIAKGSNIDFEQALLLQIRGEIVYAAAQFGCTSFALSREATSNNRVLIGQNWDYPIESDLLMVLHVIPEEGPRRIMMTFIGLTSYLGINSEGIGNFANALPWGWCEPGIPHYPFWWRIFQQKHMAGIRDIVKKTKPVQPKNCVFCDANGEIADLEMTPNDSIWLDPHEGFFVHTNHFLGEPYSNKSNLPPLMGDSVPRYNRLKALVKESYGSITVSKMQKFLSDHDNYPTSICRHEEPDGWFTSASMIAEPELGVLHVCAGNPCSGEYIHYTV